MRFILKLGRLLGTICLCLGALSSWVGCSSTQVGKYASQEDLLEDYLSQYKSTSLEIIFDRGHNSHRIVALYREPLSDLQIYRDKQLYKSLKIEDSKFKGILGRSLETAGALVRKPAAKEVGLCRTPFFISIKKTNDSFSVQGCRATEEGLAFGKLISEIEHLANSIQF